ncbi:unnamed protein product [Parnassius mnemosyne]
MNRCGFVHMQTEEQASAAIRSLNNTTFNGGVITVERGRIKERGQRGGGARGGMRGGMRGSMDRRGGGPMRGGPPTRDAPYMRDARPMGPMRGGDMRGPPMGGGMPMRNGMGAPPYDRGMERPMGGYDDRGYNGYGGEDRRGFALMDGRGRDQYGAPPMYDDRRGYGTEDMSGMYPDERRAPMYPDERDMMDRRAPMRGPGPMAPAYERPPPRAAPIPTADMFSRRSPPPMRGAAGVAGGYDRDPYAQQYPPMGRGSHTGW